MAYDPEAAAEITLQPLKRFPFDAAILFSDILIVPHAIGQELTFVAGEGPRLSPPLADASLDELQPVLERLEPIWATVARVKAQLSPETTFLGFAGSPWTVATYMVAGQGSREQAEARSLAYRDPGKFGAIIGRIEEVTLDYLSGQVEAGVDAVQLFDSWAGSLAPSEFERWVIEPTARIVERFRARHPGTPVIGFPKGRAASSAPMPAKRGSMRSGLTRRSIRPGRPANCLPAFPSREISIRWHSSPAARRCDPRSRESLTHSPAGPTSSTWAMAFSRRRRSSMSRNWFRW